MIRYPHPAFLCRLLAVLACLVFAVATGVEAHESRPAYLEIEQTGPDQFVLLWRTPKRGSARLPVALRLPEGVRETRQSLVQYLDDSVLEKHWVQTGPEGVSGQRIGFPGLELTITDAVVRTHFLDGSSTLVMARPDQPWVLIPAQRSALAVARDFLGLGFGHILSGADHLLFIFGLLLLVPGTWMLIKTITAFTLAHSITLAAATLGYVTLPAAPIEAAIALSIVFLGVEILRRFRGGTSLMIRHPWIVAFVFGLLHGLGFAGALSDAGLPQSDISLALLAFNIGVEIGQLAFVACVVAGLRLLKPIYGQFPRPIALFPAYLVGATGAFWLILRVSAF